MPRHITQVNQDMKINNMQNRVNANDCSRDEHAEAKKAELVACRLTGQSGDKNQNVLIVPTLFSYRVSASVNKKVVSMSLEGKQREQSPDFEALL